MSGSRGLLFLLRLLAGIWWLGVLLARLGPPIETTADLVFFWFRLLVIIALAGCGLSIIFAKEWFIKWALILDAWMIVAAMGLTFAAGLILAAGV